MKKGWLLFNSEFSAGQSQILPSQTDQTWRKQEVGREVGEVQYKSKKHNSLYHPVGHKVEK